MKKHIKTLLILLCLLETTFSVAISPYDTDPPEQTTIELRGLLDANAGPNDILAYVDANAVRIVFNRSFGNVSISIYNATGTLFYSDTVNTAVQQHVIIPFITSSSGTYTLILENATGYADGDFEKQP